MKCPSCSYGRLEPSFIEDLFRCHTCDRCKGNLIHLSDYLKWRDECDSDELTFDPATNIEICETKKAMTCPKTGTLMTKFRISKDTEHKLDLSRGIDAIWMDKGEWQLLKQSGLVMQLTAIFTSDWQKGIRLDETKDVFAELYQRKFGTFYQEIKEFREKLEKYEAKREVIAYLLADDPYKT